MPQTAQRTPTYIARQALIRGGPALRNFVLWDHQDPVAAAFIDHILSLRQSDPDLALFGFGVKPRSGAVVELRSRCIDDLRHGADADFLQKAVRWMRRAEEIADETGADLYYQVWNLQGDPATEALQREVLGQHGFTITVDRGLLEDKLLRPAKGHSPVVIEWSNKIDAPSVRNREIRRAGT